ncbi:MAG: PAS domain-containing sensor histidine kinase [Cucumibacter sp.]
MSDATAETAPPAPNPRARQAFFGSNRALRLLGLVVVLAAVASAAGSFLILTGVTTIEPTPEIWAIIWFVNAVLVLLVVALVLTEAILLIRSRMQKQAGSGLHARLVGMFAVAALVPALIVAVVAVIALNQGLDQWFSERTRTMVESSRLIARSYLLEHAQVLRDDIIGVANELAQARNTYANDPETFQSAFTSIAQERALPYAYLLDKDRNIVVRAQIATQGPDPQLNESGLEDVQVGTPTLIAPGRTNLVGGVVGLRGYEGIYLFVARPVDPQVLEYMRLTDQNVTEYREYESSRLVFQVTFALMYVGLALVLLLAAVWVGIALANRLVAPIRNLMIASGRVSQGDLDVRVPILDKSGDMRDLSARFNLMTHEIKSQRELLLQANQMMDQRRQFTEAVLEGVSAGVVGLDQFGGITLLNGQAAAIFASSEPDLAGTPLRQAAPELALLLDKAGKARRGQLQGQVAIARGGEERTYQVRITREGTVTDSKGYVITLDDITDLIVAQRSSAWADVARRIAHEIKNPLTPIQLSAERLRRRYSKKLADDFEVFDKCTTTIIRQVGDIGRMVDEFSAFARMPSAAIESADLAETVRQAVFLEGVRHPDIAIKTEIEAEKSFLFAFDDRLISQALTNLIKNAAESLEVAGGEIKQPSIRVSIEDRGDNVLVTVSDNGVGWPKDNRQRLLEPYMTTREKGTGLGLAIVSKIVEQHGGTVELLDAGPDVEGRVGACFAFTLPKGAGETELPAEEGHAAPVERPAALLVAGK